MKATKNIEFSCTVCVENAWIVVLSCWSDLTQIREPTGCRKDILRAVVVRTVNISVSWIEVPLAYET